MLQDKDAQALLAAVKKALAPQSATVTSVQLGSVKVGDLWTLNHVTLKTLRLGLHCQHVMYMHRSKWHLF